MSRRPPPLIVLASLPALLFATGGGCLPKAVSREELAREVVGRDPAFADILEKYQTLAGRIETYQRELALKKSSVEQSVDRLRKELQTTTETVKKRVEETQKLMAPERQEITVGLSLAEEQLRAIRAQRASVGRRMVQLRKAVKTPAAGTPAADTARFEAQFKEAIEEAQRLDRESAFIKDHVRLLKIKARLIEF